MKLVRSTFLSLATLAVVFIALLAGCSGSDPLSTTVGSLILDFQVTDPNSTQYEEAGMQIFKVVVRSAEEQDLASLGDARISLLAEKKYPIDLNATSSSVPATNLPAGTFILEQINFFPVGDPAIILVDHDPPDPMASCIDRKTEIPGTVKENSTVSSAMKDLPADRRLFLPNAPILVPSGDAVIYPIRINSAMLIQAYKNACDCSDSVYLCDRDAAGAPPPCIVSFNANGFIDELAGLDWIDYGPE